MDYLQWKKERLVDPQLKIDQKNVECCVGLCSFKQLKRSLRCKRSFVSAVHGIPKIFPSRY